VGAEWREGGGGVVWREYGLRVGGGSDPLYDSERIPLIVLGRKKDDGPYKQNKKRSLKSRKFSQGSLGEITRRKEM